MGKVKAKECRNRPGLAQRVPGGSGSKISWHSAHDGGEVVSLTHRPPLPPGMFLPRWVHILICPPIFNGEPHFFIHKTVTNNVPSSHYSMLMKTERLPKAVRTATAWDFIPLFFTVKAPRLLITQSPFARYNFLKNLRLSPLQEPLCIPYQE